jgi:hypothetical protein
MRASGVTVLGQWGVFGLHAAVVLGVLGVSVFALGMTFNYLVSLFHRRTIRQSIFARPLFARPFDREFWWIGGFAVLIGMAIGSVSLALSFYTWPIERLWFWLLISAMAIVIGVQLIISWVVMRTLEQLSLRGGLAADDMRGSAIK